MTLFYHQPISPLLAPFLLCVVLVHIIMKKFILISAFDLVLDPCLVGIDSVGSNGPLFISYLAVLIFFAADFMELNLSIPMCCSWAMLMAFWVVFMNPIFKFAQMLIELASSAQYMGFWLDPLVSLVVHVSRLLGWSRRTKISPSPPADVISLYGMLAGLEFFGLHFVGYGFWICSIFRNKNFHWPQDVHKLYSNTSLVNWVISTYVPTPGMTNIFTIGCFQIGQFYKITLVTA